MKKILVLAISLSFSNCATIIHGSKQDVGFSSNPTGASVTINGESFGKTPTVVKLQRKDQQSVKISLDGYLPYEVVLTRKVDGWIAGNIIFGGIIGLIVDAADGAMYKLSPEQLTAELRKESASASFQEKNGGIFIGITLTPNPNWEKIGTLEKGK
jgi:PEGA domain